MEDAALVLARIWKWENAGLVIKIWTPLFDPCIERYDQIPIWVKLPNLPFKYWSTDFFKLVGNTLGSHLETHFSFLKMGVCFLGRVLVLIDFRKGLSTDLIIKKGSTKFS